MESLTNRFKSFDRLSNIFWRFSRFPAVGIAFEKVMVERIADFQQQIGVDETAAKQVMHVLTCTSYLLRQPPRTPSLSCEFFFDKVSDMWCFLRGHVLEFWYRKSVESISCLNVRVSTPHLSNKLFHAVPSTAFDNLSLMSCPQNEDGGNFWTQG